MRQKFGNNNIISFIDKTVDKTVVIFSFQIYIIKTRNISQKIGNINIISIIDKTVDITVVIFLMFTRVPMCNESSTTKQCFGHFWAIALWLTPYFPCMPFDPAMYYTLVRSYQYMYQI